MTGSALFRGVDSAVFVASLCDRLRMAGIEVGLSATQRLAQALAAVPPADPTTMYWVTRSCVVNDPAQLETFDAVFSAVFDSDGLPIRPKERNTPRPMPNTTGTLIRHSGPTDGLSEAQGRFEAGFRPAVSDADDDENPIDDGQTTALPEVFPANIAALADEPFERLSADDLDLIGQWLATAVSSFPQRPSRRYRLAPSGSIDLRRTALRARSTFGEPVRLMRRTQRQKPRRVVMIADVSGSMQSFTRIYLHLMRALVVKSDAEVFTFSTSLRRVTVQLRDRDPQAAIDRMSDEVTDRFSGTRISSSLGELLASPVWSSRLRGSVVLIASDGWETGEPAELARAMRRLGRFANRVVWINPRSAGAEFEPVTQGMSAALPYVDSFVSGHSLRTMREVIDSIS